MLECIMVINATSGTLADKHPRGFEGNRVWTELSRLGDKNMFLTKP